MSNGGVYDANSKKEVKCDNYDEIKDDYSGYVPQYAAQQTLSEEGVAEVKLINQMKTKVTASDNKPSTLKTLGYDDNKIPQNEQELQAMAKKMQEENDKINKPITVDERGFLDKVTGKEKTSEVAGMVDQWNAGKKLGIELYAIDKMLADGKITEAEAERLKAGEENLNEEAEAEINKMVDEMMEFENYPYLVRGADLRCTHGTHGRKLNLPLDHGVYITGEPLIHELDCIAGDTWNITTLGICNSPVAGKFKPQPDVMLVVTDENGNSQNVKGKVCIPQIVGTWQSVFDEVRIVDNGQKDPTDKDKDINDKGTGYSAVTMDSFLVCRCQGHIFPVTPGQNDTESSDS